MAVDCRNKARKEPDSDHNAFGVDDGDSTSHQATPTPPGTALPELLRIADCILDLSSGEIEREGTRLRLSLRRQG